MTPKKIDGKCSRCGAPIEVICKCEVRNFRDQEWLPPDEVFSAGDFEAQNE